MNDRARTAGMEITFSDHGPRPKLSGTKHDMAEQMRSAPTHGERLLWDAVSRGQLQQGNSPIRVNRQQVIRGFIADFYLPSYRAIVEVDGGAHESDEQAARDERRDDAFLSWDYSILRIATELAETDAALCGEVIKTFADSIADLACRGRWTFRSYGILRRPGIEPQHWFRLSPDLSEEFPVWWGSSIGEVECHGLSDCQSAGCLERFGSRLWR